MPEYKNQYKDEQEVSEVILKPDRCALIVWVQLQQHFGPAALRNLGQANTEGQDLRWTSTGAREGHQGGCVVSDGV